MKQQTSHIPGIIMYNRETDSYSLYSMDEEFDIDFVFEWERGQLSRREFRQILRENNLIIKEYWDPEAGEIWN